MYMFIYMHVYITCSPRSWYLAVYIYIYIYIYIYMHIYVYICIYIDLYRYIYMHIYMWYEAYPIGSDIFEISFERSKLMLAGLFVSQKRPTSFGFKRSKGLEKMTLQIGLAVYINNSIWICIYLYIYTYL